MTRLLLLVGLLALSTPALAQDCGGFGDDADCDADGVTVGQGDCDDNNADVRPGTVEVCGDEADNDCDGLFDQSCDRSAQGGSVQGGGGCTGGAGVAGTALLVVPLFGFRRRREA